MLFHYIFNRKLFTLHSFLFVKQCFSHFVTAIGLATLQYSKHGVAKNLRAQGEKSNTSKKKPKQSGRRTKIKNGGQRQSYVLIEVYSQ